MNWVKQRLPLIFVAGVLVVSFLGLTLSSQIGQQAKTESYNAPISEPVSVPVIGEIIEGVPTEPNSERQAQDEKRQLEVADHRAQIRMARYALIGVGLGVFGSLLLFWTLRYTRSAAESAQETLKIAQDTLSVTERATKAEFQPYLTISRLKVPLFETESSELEGVLDGENYKPEFCVHRIQGDISLTPIISVFNKGKIPAREIFCLAAAELHYSVWDDNAGGWKSGVSKHIRSIQQYFAHQINSGDSESLEVPMCFKTGINSDLTEKEEVGLFGFRLEAGVRISWIDDFSSPSRRVVVATFSDLLAGGGFEPIGFIETTAEEYDNPDYWNEQNLPLPLGIYGPNVMRDIGRKHEVKG